MRIANYAGRAIIVTDDGVVDIGKASGGSLPSDPDQVIVQLDDVRTWYRAAHPEVDPCITATDLLADLTLLGPPSVAPRQIFAVGLNYAEHGAETGMDLPDQPLVFTKFASSLNGPGAEIPLPSDSCDWEVELVVIIGSGGRDIPTGKALDRVAGFCIGQDISERRSQMSGSPPQFSLAKSHKGFSPIGPWITTLDELANSQDLAMRASIDGETVQSGRTGEMIFDVAALVSYLSTVCELFPGDLIFTGTPAGVGFSRTPSRYLAPGNQLCSSIEGLGELRNHCVNPNETSTT
jgi:2,4-didehydro-3-deoxy-L-rhamnonate hydrolase